MKVALIHGYSADNSGDGLLVRAAIALIREALSDACDITVYANYPDSFHGLGVPVVRTKPGRAGLAKDYLGAIRNRFADYDLVVGVGGGYLRAPVGLQSLKTGLVNLPQLRAAALGSAPSIYLPQSVGPLRGPLGVAIRRYLNKIDAVYLRDDRSLEEALVAGAHRAPDMAILTMTPLAADLAVTDIPVMNTREHRGRALLPRVAEVRDQLGTVDGFVQSRVASNNDFTAVAALRPRKILSSDELYGDQATPRVVVAMRLHCALEALARGHFVIHLSYERKGFGAFQDLGLSDYVVNVNRFDPAEVVRQVRTLLLDEAVREAYRCRVDTAIASAPVSWSLLLDQLRSVARAVP